MLPRMATTVRVMTAADMDVVMGWAADEGWNPGLGDGLLMRAADPDGFLVAVDRGEVVGGIGVPRFGDGFAFAGLLIVRPDHRRSAVGTRLALAGLRHAGDRVLGTDGVLERVAAYERLGFESAFAHVRWSGRPGPAETPGVVDRAHVDADALVDLDDACFPGDRRAFMRAWLGTPHVVRAVMRDGRARAFGVARQAVDGWRVGPLLGDDPVHVESVLRSLAAALPGAVLHVDVPDRNPRATALMERLGMTRGFTCMRMYRGGAPAPVEVDAIYGNGTLEVG